MQKVVVSLRTSEIRIVGITPCLGYLYPVATSIDWSNDIPAGIVLGGGLVKLLCIDFYEGGGA